MPKTPANKLFGKKGKKTPKSSIKNKNVESKNAEGDKKGDGVENEKKPLKLPEAFYAEIDDYDITDAPKRSNTYFRFIEKSAEEMVSTFLRNM